MTEVVIGVGIEQSPEVDLPLIGLQFKTSFEQTACRSCQTLDRQHDVDMLAVTSAGQPKLISYRRQPDYDYRTITVRTVSDHGNADVQGAKLTQGRSLAHRYVQSYPSGVAWADVRDLRNTVRRRQQAAERCPKHDRYLRGKDGQTFEVFCQWCTAMHYVPRQPREVTIPVLPDGTIPGSAFDPESPLWKPAA